MGTAVRYMRELLDLNAVIRNLLQHGDLIRLMTWRNFNARYRGSFAGLFWSFFQPLVIMTIYTVVFSLFLKVRFSTDASPFTFSVYLLCGLLPWNALSEGLSLSTTVIRTNTNLVKRVVFPLEILPINLALTAAIQQIIGFVLLFPLAWLVIGPPSWTLVLVPVVLAFQLLFSVGLNWIVSSVTVYLPDMGQMISLMLTVWLFLTPIFYPDDIVPSQIMFVFRLNPLARLVRLYRDVFLSGQLPAWQGLLATGLICLGVFMVGYFWFMHTKRGFADVV